MVIIGSILFVIVVFITNILPANVLEIQKINYEVTLFNHYLNDAEDFIAYLKINPFNYSLPHLQIAQLLYAHRANEALLKFSIAGFNLAKLAQYVVCNDVGAAKLMLTSRLGYNLSIPDIANVLIKFNGGCKRD